VTATAAIVVAVIPGLLAASIIQNKLVLLVLLTSSP
jgi:hypothetical protein